ncbi:MAG TPA: ABC transporter substrate-binding protein [Stellaceae bacterium]|nr:ABC transporter substrate-binding protein [Stellaceae bacterium]
MRLRLYENYRFVLYAPFYAAHAIGAYAAEGLAVEMLPSPGVGKAEQALIDGDVDVLWAGPMRVAKHHDAHPGSPLICFAEVVGRDPFSIVGRLPNPGFHLADLARLRFASVSEVPTPWLCLQQDLREAGIDPSRLDRVSDRAMAENLEALRSGSLDAIQTFEPVTEQALSTGAGHLWHAASTRGRTSYTALVTTRERLQCDPEPLRRMVRAIYRTQQWLHAHTAAELAAVIAGYFPTLGRDVLTGALSRYRAQEIWDRDPGLPENGFARLCHALASSGFIARPASYLECVDNRLARQIIAE